MPAPTRALAACALTLLLGAPALAAPGDPVLLPTTFAGGAVSAWNVSAVFVSSTGGYDHLIDYVGHGINPSVSVNEWTSNPIFATTDPSNPTPGGAGGAWPVSNPGDTVGLGTIGSGNELVFRLVNYGSPRLGVTGKPYDVLYSGTVGRDQNPAWSDRASGPNFADVTTFVESSGVRFRVGFDDLPCCEQDYQFAVFDVIAAPVPEPHEWAMMLAGLGLVGWTARRRRTDSRRADAPAAAMPA